MKDYSVLDELVPKTEELHRAIFDNGYEQGMDDAWECARKITLISDNGGMPSTEINAVFGLNPYNVMLDYTASEAIKKIKAWKQKKEQRYCSIAEVICPYEIPCEDCELHGSMKRVKTRARENLRTGEE